MINWATDFIDAIGLIGVALLIALESIFPPIPSELILLLTGSNVAAGRFGYVGGVIASVIALSSITFLMSVAKSAEANK